MHLKLIERGENHKKGHFNFILFSFFNNNLTTQFYVLDVPSPPQDLDVTDVYATSCVVKWKTPKDDGGSPLIQYVIERQDLSVKGKVISKFNQSCKSQSLYTSLLLSSDSIYL